MIKNKNLPIQNIRLIYLILVLFKKSLTFDWVATKALVRR